MSAVEIREPKLIPREPLTPELSPPPPPTPSPGTSRRSGRAWRWTVGTGLALVLVATVHIVAQHFVVQSTGGLRTYHQVLQYIANPVMFVLESGFLIAVTIHAMLGIRSVLLDLDLRERARRRLDAALWTLGSITVIYGLILLITLASRA